MKVITGSPGRGQAMNPYRIFMAEAVIYILLLYGTNSLVLTDTLLINSFSNLPETEASTIIAGITKSKHLSYFLSPIVFAIKLFFICAIVHAAIVTTNKEISFRNTLNLLLKAELVFILSALIRFGWLVFFAEVKTIESVDHYRMVSLANLIPLPEKHVLFYALHAINLVELIYITVLAKIIADFLKQTFWQSVQVVLFSYGAFLLCWIVLVTYLKFIYT